MSYVCNVYFGKSILNSKTNTMDGDLSYIGTKNVNRVHPYLLDLN